jgi:hypothetical protein
LPNAETAWHLSRRLAARALRFARRARPAVPNAAIRSGTDAFAGFAMRFSQPVGAHTSFSSGTASCQTYFYAFSLLKFDFLDFQNFRALTNTVKCFLFAFSLGSDFLPAPLWGPSLYWHFKSGNVQQAILLAA